VLEWLNIEPVSERAIQQRIQLIICPIVLPALWFWLSGYRVNNCRWFFAAVDDIYEPTSYIGSNELPKLSSMSLGICRDGILDCMLPSLYMYISRVGP